MLQGLPAVFLVIQGEGKALVQSHQSQYSFHSCKPAVALHGIMVKGDQHSISNG